MRKTCLNNVYELAKKDTRVIYIGSDVGAGTLDNFKEEMPERFFIEGISEQHVVGMAAGLALEGNVPYVNTIGVFLTRRCFEQIVMDVCLHNLPVRLIGNGGGLVYAPLGPSHLAVDDIAILRTVPNMTILAPADAGEMARLMPLTLDYGGPIFIRLAKGGDPIVSIDDGQCEIGKAVCAKKGGEALLITTGVTLKPALEAARILDKKGIETGVTHLHTIKPIDFEAILKSCEKARLIITVEEGTITGGLGSAVAEIMAEANFSSFKKFKRIGIPDAFCENYGSQALLWEKFGITADNIARTALALAGEEDII
ncbi:Transketolase, C-terminal section [hydrothermal vent metagenome]|uniref:Transketolase, C-terminal section n=1 Tax=hydrothermal vent metagenome TaxID=652676 RepID=A0A3B1CQ24_9ZZZZ